MKSLKKLGAPLSELLVLSAPLLTLAGAPNVPNAPFTTIDSFLGANGPICTVFRYLFGFLILIAVIFIILAAYRYLTAGGDPEKVKAANKQIIFAAVAVVVALIARVIPNLALGLIGAGTNITSC